MSRHPDDELSAFPATQWSLVDAVRGGDPQARRRALDTLLTRYLPALRAYLVLERRMDADRAADVLQSFVADKIVERDLIARAEKSRGKLRTFLLTALQRFAIDVSRKRDDRGSVSVDDVEPSLHPIPSAVFDREWASQVINQTLARMEANCRQWGRLDLWEIFRGRVLATAFDSAPPTPYEQLAARFGFSSNDQAANALVTAKRLFGRLLREVISEYAPDAADLEDEIRDLRAALSGSGAKGTDLMSLT